jgi:hypothetical protein
MTEMLLVILVGRFKHVICEVAHWKKLIILAHSNIMFINNILNADLMGLSHEGCDLNSLVGCGKL